MVSKFLKNSLVHGILVKSTGFLFKDANFSLHRHFGTVQKLQIFLKGHLWITLCFSSIQMAGLTYLQLSVKLTLLPLFRFLLGSQLFVCMQNCSIPFIQKPCREDNLSAELRITISWTCQRISDRDEVFLVATICPRCEK